MSELEPTPANGNPPEVIDPAEPVVEETPVAPEEQAAPRIPEEALLYDPRFTPEVLEALRGEAVVKDIPGRANLSGVEKTESLGYAGTSFGEAFVGHTDDEGRLHYTPLSSFDFDDGRISEDRRQQLAASGVDFGELSKPLPGMPGYRPAPGTDGGNGNGNGNGHEGNNGNNGENEGNNSGDENESLGKKIDIDHPESVANNYTVRERDSGLLVAESRAYHSSKTHKSDIDDRSDRQRGIVVSERTHPETGETYFVAERPPSKKRRRNIDGTEPDPQQDPNNPNDPGGNGNNPNQGPNQGPNRRGEQQVPHEFRQPRLGFEHPSFAYGRTVDGEYQTVVRYNQDGDKMIWNVNEYANKPDREVLMHFRDDNGQDQVRFIRGGRVYDIIWSERSRNSSLPMLKVRDMKPERIVPIRGTGRGRHMAGEQLKSQQIGTDWGDDGRVLQSVMVNAGRGVAIPAGAEVDSELASDPFARIKEVISHMEMGAAGLNMDTGVEEDFYRRAFDEMFSWEHSHIGEVSPQDVADRVSAYAARFEDETYAPSAREFKEMRVIADMLGGYEGQWDEQAVNLNIGGRDLDPRLVNAFLEGANPDRWRMNDFQTGTYHDIVHKYRESKRINFGTETKPGQSLLTGTSGGVYTIPEFLDIKNEQKQAEDRERLARGERPGPKPSRAEREREYYEYLFRRAELGRMILDIDSWDDFGLRSARNGSNAGNGGNNQPRNERQNQTQTYDIDPDLVASRGVIDYLSRVRDRFAAGWERRMRN